MGSSSPGAALEIQQGAGPESPCATKSTTSPRRAAPVDRIVQERMRLRVSSGSSRHCVYESSPPGSSLRAAPGSGRMILMR